MSTNGVGAGRNVGGVGDGRAGSAAADGNPPMAGASPRLLRSIRWWLRAFPPRWRRVHERETADLLLELAPERARRLDARTAVGLLVGGWGTRWRGRPSAGRYLGYRFDLMTIDPSHREWARDDIESRWYPLRRALAAPAFFGAGVGIMNLALWLPSHDWAGIAGPMLRPWGVLLPALIVMSYAQRRAIRRRAIVRHLLPRLGEPASAAVYWPAPTPRPRTSAASAIVGIRWDIAQWAVVGLVLGLAWQVAEIFGGFPMIAGPACLAMGGVLLVWAGVGRWVVRHGQGPDSVSEPVAWIDVWRTMHHNELLVDQPVDGFMFAPNAAATSPMTFPPECATDDGTRVG